MTGFMSFKLKICENINLYNYIFLALQLHFFAFSSGVMWL